MGRSEEVTQVGPRSPGGDLERAEDARTHTHTHIQCGNQQQWRSSQTAQVQVPALPLTVCMALDKCVAFTGFLLYKMWGPTTHGL